MKHKALAKEALDWIDSLELPRRPSFVRFGYFDDLKDSAEPADQQSPAERRFETLQRNFTAWVSKHKRKHARKMDMLQLEVDCAVKIMDMRMRRQLHRWRHFVLHSILSVSAAHARLLREKGLCIKLLYKQRMCLLYWLQRAKHRKNLKRLWLQQWSHLRHGRHLFVQGLRLRLRLMKRIAFLKWKRRYKWPLVATQRNHFMSKQALKCITHRTTKLADMKAHHSTAIQAFLRKYWSVLVTHVQFHRRSVRRSRVGKDTFSMRCVSNALLYWVQYTGQHCKLNTALTNACANIRAKRLTSAVAVWKQHAQCEVKKIVNMKTSYLFYKRQMFHSFLDGVRRYLQQSLVITTRNNSSAVKRRKTRYLLFRGVLFKKRHTLLRLWRHNMSSIVRQRTARHWGLRWWKRAMFRNLQLVCRKRRNDTLLVCYASLQCKARSMRTCLLIWRQRTLLATSLTALSSYGYKKKFLRTWYLRGKQVQNQLFLQRRAGLRWALNRLHYSVRQWYRNITQERHCRYSLRVFRKLHPVPAVSMIKRVFHAWKYDYTQFRKDQKSVFKHVVSVRKSYAKRRIFGVWFDTFERHCVHKRHMLRALKILYQLYVRRRRSIQQLSNALILQHEVPRVHSLRAFLVAKGLMIHSRTEHERFYTQCFVRKYMHLWRTYSTTRRQQSVQFHRAYKRAIRQCSFHFACIYRTENKHRKWEQWRGLKFWYQLLLKRREVYQRLCTKLWARQCFYRWIESYNRKLINYHLRIPSVSVIPSFPEAVSHHHRANTSHSQVDHSFARDTTLHSSTVGVDFSTHSTGRRTQSSRTMAIDTSMQLLQYHPAYTRQLDKQRLQSLSTSRDAINLSAISHSSSVHSSGETLRRRDKSTIQAPKYGKLIEPPRAMAVGLGGAARALQTPVALYPKKATVRDKGSSRAEMDLSRNSISRYDESADRSSLAVSSVTKYTGKAKPLWGRLISEDSVDAARRSYSGQYLLSSRSSL